MATISKSPFNLSAMPSVASDDEEESFVVLTSHYPDSCELDAASEDLAPIEGEGTISAMHSLHQRELSLLQSAAGHLSLDPPGEKNVQQISTPASPDSYYSDVQKHVDQLIKENEELKGIIAQNNDAMKYQMEQIKKWKLEVDNTFEANKTKLREAKMCVDKYREENEKLKMDVDKYKNIKELQDEEIMNLKRRPIDQENLKNIADKAEQNLSDFNLQVSKQKIAELEEKLLEEQRQCKELKQAFESVKLKHEQSVAEMKALNVIANECTAWQEMTSVLQKNIEALQAENENLKSKLDEARKLQDLVLAKEAQLEKLKDDLALSKLSVDAQGKALGEEIASLKSQIEELQKCQPENGEQVQHLRQQLMNSQVMITEYQQAVTNKDREIIEARNMLQQCGTSKDDLFALREQLQVYKCDFEAEKEARKALKREKDQVDSDLQNLHRRNQQLQEEIELMRERGFVLCSTSQTSTGNESAANVQADFECPKCRFKFQDYRTLENHVFRCLELDGFP